MRIRLLYVMTAILATAGIAGAQTMPGHGMMSREDMIKVALSAGPADIAAKATVVEMTADGKTMEIRKGTNGWVCMAHPEPMCIDKEWQAFFDAYMNKKDPQVKTLGVGYMLRGEKTGVSNTDPFATAPTAANEWVISPAHVMILTPDTKLLETLPADFRTGGPWVMWKGTKYAHIMIPTAAVTNKATSSK